MSTCNLCPRMCDSDRKNGKRGFCNSPYEMKISKYMLHLWEEPCICTGKGAGTIFFSGCNLRCIFCQNMKISRGEIGQVYNRNGLKKIIFDLLDMGAQTIEFVTPTQYTEQIAGLLKEIKGDIPVPIVWNSSGYERIDSLLMLEGLVDVYLPDFKYCSSELSAAYSNAKDYGIVAKEALNEMVRQTGKPVYCGEKLIKGTIVRHLVLPGCRKDSMRVLDEIAKNVRPENVILSLMSQYTPDFYINSKNMKSDGPEYINLERRVTSFEYNSVLSHAKDLGFDGYFQNISSADKKYTPDFI